MGFVCTVLLVYHVHSGLTFTAEESICLAASLSKVTNAVLRALGEHSDCRSGPGALPRKFYWSVEPSNAPKLAGVVAGARRSK